MSHGTRPTVLLIESDASLRRLIVLGLQYRGMQVIEVGSPASLPSFEQQSPGLLVLDVDAGLRSDWSLLEAAQAHPQLATIPMIVLAWDTPTMAGSHQTATETRMVCLSKPFDARTLYATIEQLLVVHAAPTYPEEVLLASHTAAAAVSIWPLITAVGLLLAVVGFLFQIAVTAFGLLVVLVALLWWTLGTKSEQPALPVAPTAR